MDSALVRALDGTPLRALVRHAVPGRVQRQPAEECARHRGDLSAGRSAPASMPASLAMVASASSSRRSFCSPARRARSPTVSTRRSSLDGSRSPRSPSWRSERGDCGAAACRFCWRTLFCLGTHSTVFGPIKYALLPQHLRDDELVAGNALVEAGTFLAILARNDSRRQHRPPRQRRAHRRRCRHGRRHRRLAEPRDRSLRRRRRLARTPPRIRVCCATRSTSSAM